MSSPYKNKAWLTKRYVEEQKTVEEIAIEAQVTTMTVRNWLKGFKLNVRI